MILRVFTTFGDEPLEFRLLPASSAKQPSLRASHDVTFHHLIMACLASSIHFSYFYLAIATMNRNSAES